MTTRRSSFWFCPARLAGFAPVVLFSLILGPAGVCQVSTASTIKIKGKSPKPQIDSFRGEVLNFTNVAITVRDRENMALVRTFTFSERLLSKTRDRRMENGDRVTVRFIRGSETAVDLKGKLRRSEHPDRRIPLVH